MISNNLHQEWEVLYNTFKGPSWPDCPNAEDFHLLPEWVQKELILDFGYSPPTDDVKKFICNGPDPITVFYTLDTDGGGSSFGQDYIPTIKKKYLNKKFSKAFEWCGGPGFIGYSLLSHKLCNSLCLNDIYDPAIELANYTKMWADNNCTNRVSTYLLKDLELLPKHEMFDLVVSNPPHFKQKVSRLTNTNRLCCDINWESHKNFFSNIKSHLLPGGVILLQENYKGSSPDDFKDFIEKAGLQITDCFDSIETFYFLEIKST